MASACSWIERDPAPNSHNRLLSHHNRCQPWGWLASSAARLRSKWHCCSGGGGEGSIATKEVMVLWSPLSQPMKYSVKLSAEFLGAWTGTQVTTQAVFKKKRFFFEKKKKSYMVCSKSIHSQHNHLYLQNKHYCKQHFGPCKTIQKMLQHSLV